MDQSDPFKSALSSIVSSPAASNAVGSNHNGGGGGGFDIAMGDLIGRSENIRNSGSGGDGELSPQSYINSTNDSYCGTPLNSPPKLNLLVKNHHHYHNQIRRNFSIPSGNKFPTFSSCPADSGFAERATKFSCFGNPNFGFNDSEFPYRSMPIVESDELLRVSSNRSFNANASQMGNLENKKCCIENAELEESSISEQIPGGDLSLKDHINCNAQKRKSIRHGKTMEVQVDAKAVNDNIEESSTKRHKYDESIGNEKAMASELNGNSKNGAEGNQKQQSKENPKPPEPPTDYIHVRARRGQATDSHSLAERVRREKINERMKFLQDIVPGCNKVTGKAVMLDEIINYVQSLQRQVEFLSMKLATLNPRGEFNMEALLSKDVLQSRVYPFDSSVYGLLESQQGPSLSLPSSISDGTQNQFSINSLNAVMHRNPSMQLPPMNGFGEVASQVSTFWADDLQNIVQMGLAQNQPDEKILSPWGELIGL